MAVDDAAGRPMSPYLRVLLVGVVLALAAGAVFGLVRGLSYPPTVAAAIVEGALLIGVPASIGVCLLVGVVRVADLGMRAIRRTRTR